MVFVIDFKWLLAFVAITAFLIIIVQDHQLQVKTEVNKKMKQTRIHYIGESN